VAERVRRGRAAARVAKHAPWPSGGLAGARRLGTAFLERERGAGCGAALRPSRWLYLGRATRRSRRVSNLLPLVLHRRMQPGVERLLPDCLSIFLCGRKEWTETGTLASGVLATTGHGCVDLCRPAGRGPSSIWLHGGVGLLCVGLALLSAHGSSWMRACGRALRTTRRPAELPKISLHEN
jgi:hypothetical protein